MSLPKCFRSVSFRWFLKFSPDTCLDVVKKFVQRPVVWRARMGPGRAQIDGVRLLCRRPHKNTTFGVHAQDVVLCFAVSYVEVGLVSFLLPPLPSRLLPRVASVERIFTTTAAACCAATTCAAFCRACAASARAACAAGSNAHSIHDPLQFRYRFCYVVWQQVVFFFLKLFFGLNASSLSRRRSCRDLFFYGAGALPYETHWRRFESTFPCLCPLSLFSLHFLDRPRCCPLAIISRTGFSVIRLRFHEMRFFHFDALSKKVEGGQKVAFQAVQGALGKILMTFPNSSKDPTHI